MKKVLSILLVLAMLGLPFVSLADYAGYEEIVIDEGSIPYEPAELTLGVLGIRMLVPVDWADLTDQIEQPDEGMTLLIGEEEGETWLSIDIIAVDLSNSSYESLAEGLEQNGMSDVAVKIINGHKFILFTQEDGIHLCALLPSLDGAITFYYSSADDAAERVFTAILSTIELGDFDIPEKK